MRRRQKFHPRKIMRHCLYCKEGKEPDYKDAKTLATFISDRGKIIGRSRTSMCAKHQRRFTQAVKRARILALLPFTQRART